jgi:hypothetical protein
MNQGPYAPYPQQPQAYPPYQGFAQPPPYGQPSQDEQHLNILSICTFCYAGLVALIGLFFGIYLIIGVVIAGAALSSSSTAGRTEAGVMGGVFAVIGLVAMLFTFGKASLLVWSGMSMRKRQRPTLSFVAAALACMNIPLGTTLGVFTFIVLSRPSVKALYAHAAMQRVA